MRGVKLVVWRGAALAATPLGLVLDPDSLGNAVDVVEVGDDLDRVVDRHVVPAVVAELVGVGEPDGGGRLRQLDGVVAEGPYPRLEVGLAVVVRRVSRELLVCALGTEVVCVRECSVVAVIVPRGDRGE